jgi:hypothetical protein
LTPPFRNLPNKKKKKIINRIKEILISAYKADQKDKKMLKVRVELTISKISLSDNYKLGALTT